MGLPNPRLVQMIGFCKENEELMIVSELMKGGSLESIIKNKSKYESLSSKQLFQIIYDSASGIGFLHSKQVVHLDIKPDNILLDEHFRAKIADCGLSRTGVDGFFLFD
jgi:serine/threonine protein kinase